jgi:hypothetical protein
MKETKEQKIIWQIYKEMYAVSTLPADFDGLINLVEKNEKGKRITPFDNYEILEKDYCEILERNLKGKRITKLKQQMIKNTVALGISPRFKKGK